MSIYMGLLLIGMIVTINGLNSTSTIETDLNDITKLHTEYLKRFPSELHSQLYDDKCVMIYECCPTDRDTLYVTFIDEIINMRCLMKGTSKSSCRRIINKMNLLGQAVDPKYFELLIDIQSHMDRTKKWKKQMEMVCSDNEFYGYFCDRDNTEKFQSCQRKVLKMIARKNNDDGTFYNQYVEQMKQDYINDNNKLSKYSFSDS
ncbi:unnamed protein product [Adineta steineri]|uniref:Uncharacterized protein n=1 Tax=Adineta steineri TaxID=433720 RepID=A0A814QPF1_9BILA|nr:unnamed protein product [Adineta steineri]CAF1538960.1 unnamed protein product [Adineta steineri]